ncbi:MAG TPA: toxin-antitoxin system HicB family antitoxin [Treponemataceae bacterium]|nr:toxin-antitoxin system HicB family antitoxin [Treponemataceae bacterium]
MAHNSYIDKYTYRLEWSQEDQAHVARCLEFPSLMAHGSSSVEALKEIEVVVSETIHWMKEDGEDIPEPFGLKKYKGNLTLRVPPEVHKNIAIKSAEEGVSINKYILSIIA